VGAIPGIFLIAILIPDRGPPPPSPPGATDIFDGTYVGVEARLTADRHLSGTCSSWSPPRSLTISQGSVRAYLADSTGEGPVSADGEVKMPVGGNLLTLQIDRLGIARGQFDTRYCTYRVVWQKE